MASADDIIQENIATLRSQITNALTIGDNIVRQSGGKQMVSYVADQLNKLESKKKELENDIVEKERLIHASNRDFSDAQPVSEDNTTLRVIEDHTVAILLVSYLFMLAMGMYLYVIRSPFIIKGIAEALLGGFIISIFSFIVIYYIC